MVWEAERAKSRSADLIVLDGQVEQFDTYGGACRGFPVVFDVPVAAPSERDREFSCIARQIA